MHRHQYRGCTLPIIALWAVRAGRSVRNLRRAYEFARRSPHNIALHRPRMRFPETPLAHIARSGGVFVWHSPRPSYWETKGKSDHEYAIRNRIVASDAVVHRQ